MHVILLRIARRATVKYWNHNYNYSYINILNEYSIWQQSNNHLFCDHWLLFSKNVSAVLLFCMYVLWEWLIFMLIMKLCYLFKHSLWPKKTYIHLKRHSSNLPVTCRIFSSSNKLTCFDESDELKKFINYKQVTH